MSTTDARPRSPAQIEASRRNGARSRGPVTPEGKARASRNALTHGLSAMHHLVVAGEIAQHLDELIARMIEETGAVGEVETRLARRLAIAFWKGERAERMEVALLDAAPVTRMNGYQQEPADPLTTFDVRRFNAIRGQQAQLGREISRCLKELRQLRKDRLEECTHEPGAGLENEPEATLQIEPESPPAAANDDVMVDLDEVRNEPEPDQPGALPPPVRAYLEQLLAAEDWPNLTRLAAIGALRPLGLEPADLASAQAFARALQRLDVRAA